MRFKRGETKMKNEDLKKEYRRLFRIKNKVIREIERFNEQLQEINLEMVSIRRCLR